MWSAVYGFELLYLEFLRPRRESTNLGHYTL